MIFRQLIHDDLGCQPCLTGDEDAGVAVSLFLSGGPREVIHVADGGVGTWERHGWPIEPTSLIAASVR